MRRLIAGYYRLLSVLLAISVATLIVPVTLQIVARFTELIPHWIWTEEMARFLFIWMVMLGAMIGVRDGTHFDVDVWPELGARANALLRIVSSIFILVFALVFVWYGFRFVQFGWDQSSELADLFGLGGGIVIVRRRSTGEERLYATGLGSAWFGTLLMDLARGHKAAASTPPSHAKILQ